MNENRKKVKLILFLAIVVIVLLFVLNIVLLVSIYNKNKQLDEQYSTIAQQEQMLEYYNNQESQK